MQVQQLATVGRTHGKNDPKERIGQRVKIVALRAAPEFNGTLGTVTDFDGTAGRFTVFCEYDGTKKALT